ncbi:hypothetical protein B9Z51_08780 [Limnohabitans sp. T6-5]|uniref:helix-turn-helix domain-containing protein n=1 Tax=Limnohabitans sp. T6-5 TaxID=1100724 RepID=UPI000D3AEAE7|nr:hypothetical protein [Limnohabitans sp. T6-5]PUE09015.1 hypothetical protein B9Z51_08780 [Limnohabitans sp. T6-5]
MTNKPESLTTTLRRRLSEVDGLHNTIARETGVSQATISRIHTGGCSPTLATAERIFGWFERYDKSARRLKAGGVIRRVGRPATATFRD